MGKKRIIEFFVDRKHVRNNSVSVIGRCYDSPITIEDSFSSIYSMRIGRSQLQQGRRVSLTVIEINLGIASQANVIDASYTGELVLRGTGAESIVVGDDILWGESNAELPKSLVFRKDEQGPEKLGC
jgi:hypothetical protein